MRTFLAATLLLTGMGLVSAAAAATLPATLMDPYLRVQVALAADRTSAVKNDAAVIAAAATALGEPARPIVSAAQDLGRAADAAAVRVAFGVLSDAMLAYARATGSQPPAGVNVMFCPMVKKSWLQKGADVRNPYYGSGMLTCGEVKK